MNKERILHLTLKKKWFDMIASGEKTEEYRENKHYWATRLLQTWFYDEMGLQIIPKEFDIIIFRNGYSRFAPVMTVECKGISIGYGNYQWGGNGETFIIKLGKVLSIDRHDEILNDNYIPTAF